ncbi:uncharacterized protein DUF4249 [Winogradskyella epiphytica]|uniref:Uncharacterized protein DUF4249 n=1 Tax=Winogradskyella epiphytica TaxID=262005 RepID=A0A2V4XZ49_9FLAO|nr:DUF4249 family protein [Winogradskyella epiphytica]PYE81428.1 uncharacterized protein DUF4249 [Winogradskyella epiphytica]GGW65184.1 hypothetical protein GCM10008085_16650 [Winogradskyella epiphytica]
MKKLIYTFIALTFLFSCQDVIDVDLNETAPRLVIEASINWFKNTPGNEQTIKLSLSAPFFQDSIPPANGATIQITDANNNVFNFIEEGNTGIYITHDFIPVIDQEYTLVIDYNNETFTATETLKSVVPIDYVEQNNEGGFSGEDIELKAFFMDPANIDNYYFFEFISDIPVVPTLAVYEDTFTDGNANFGFYTEEDLEAGDHVTIRNYGVSKQFYEFMFILLQQGGQEGGGPFETQPATVRGNCINTTNSEHYPFGYFRLSEVDELIYTIQ